MSAREVDNRADIYALGAMTYHMLTGQPPFNGAVGEILFAHLQRTPPNPCEVRPDLPASVSSVIMRAVAKNLGDRFDTASEFAEQVWGTFSFCYQYTDEG